MYLNAELLAIDWSRDGRWAAGVVIPERMIAMKHPKAPRLLSDMAIKYGLIQHYLPRGSTVLDVGCGSGYGTSMLQGFGYNVTGVDVSERNINIAKHRKDINFICGKVEDLKETFDAVVSVDMIEHVIQSEQAPLVVAMVDRLKRGGVFLIDTPLAEVSGRVSKQHLWELSSEDFGRLIQDVGPWSDFDRYYTVRFHNVYTVCVKNNQAPPSYRDFETIMMDNQIIVATL
jgi:SAM-dependent methyltransferase